MENNKKHNNQLAINDLIDDAITDAVTRRELVALSDEEAARVGGGLTIEGDTKVAVNECGEIGCGSRRVAILFDPPQLSLVATGRQSSLPALSANYHR